MRYRSKPVVIEAKRLDASPASASEIVDWAAECETEITCEHDGGESHVLKIPTLEGVMTASVGDWIIKGTRDEFYPCKPDVFATKYEPA